MKLPFRVPYRWIPRCWWKNITAIFDDLRYGVYNVIRWIPVIWFDVDWDWSALARVMEYKLRRSAKLETEHGHHTTSKKDGKDMLICANLLQRLIEDEYSDRAMKVFSDRRQAYKIAAGVQHHDQYLLGKIIGKHLTHWWD